MLLRSLVLSLLALLAALPGAARAPLEGGVTMVGVYESLDVGDLAVLKRAIGEARSRGDVLLLEIRTPGGRVDLMWQMAQAIEDASDSGLVTVAWVRKAHSAGVLIALSCDRIFIESSGSIGSATPIMPNLAGDWQTSEKFTSSMRAEFKSWADAHGRSGLLAAAMVDPELAVYRVRHEGETKLMSGTELDDAKARGDDLADIETISAAESLLNLSSNEALEFGFADLVVDELEDVVAKISTRGVEPTFVRRSRSEDLASWVDGWAFLLIGAGLVFAYMELKAPGFGIPGIVSILCFAVFLVGRYLAGLADVPQIVMVVAGIVLIVVELFLVPGTLWAGISGAVLVVGGLIWANLGPGIPLATPMGRELFLDSTFNTLLTAFVAVFVMYGLSWILPQTPILGRLVVAPRGGSQSGAAAPEASGTHGELAKVGALGRALTDLRPVGKVALDGDELVEFEASSVGAAVERGGRVRVSELRAGRLLVEAVEETSA